jgi:hypothetical protein
VAQPTTQSLHALTGMSGELERAITQGGRASMTDSSSCARSNPARPLLGLLVRSLSIRRSRARSRSATVYCRGSGRVRFLRGRFAALLPRMNCFPVAMCRSDYPANTHFDDASRLCMKQPITALSWRRTAPNRLSRGRWCVFAVPPPRCRLDRLSSWTMITGKARSALEFRYIVLSP